MSNSSKKGLGLTTFVNYLAFALAGIDMSILAQYKTELAMQWTGKAADVASAYYVIGAIGLGGLIASIFTGPISDFFGH
ncbi:MAG: MFS transporter, partial [Lactobacillus sp.]|nr:MFS transporter [Lactobacillus sp.]MCI1916518.1 MFS transporter [Lactobacillus sp.]